MWLHVYSIRRLHTCASHVLAIRLSGSSLITLHLITFCHNCSYHTVCIQWPSTYWWQWILTTVSEQSWTVNGVLRSVVHCFASTPGKFPKFLKPVSHLLTATELNTFYDFYSHPRQHQISCVNASMGLEVIVCGYHLTQIALLVITNAVFHHLRYEFAFCAMKWLWMCCKHDYGLLCLWYVHSPADLLAQP